MDFPDSAAFGLYQIRGSKAGTRPSDLLGLEVPLTQDHFFHMTLMPRYPHCAVGFLGCFDALGDGFAHLAPGPNELPPRLINKTLYFAAASRPIGGPWRYASPPVSLQLTPLPASLIAASRTAR